MNKRWRNLTSLLAALQFLFLAQLLYGLALPTLLEQGNRSSSTFSQEVLALLETERTNALRYTARPLQVTAALGFALSALGAFLLRRLPHHPEPTSSFAD